MQTIEAIRRPGIQVTPGQTIADAAALMEKTSVGALAVVDGHNLVGIVTDRDLVRRVLARGADAKGRIDSVMSAPVVTIAAESDLHDAFAIFRTHAVRRLAVMRDGTFVGMITIDDLMMDIAADLTDIARPVTAEVLFGHRDSPVPATS